jgi:NAD(P)-dependent dehydrogenase (short-subunit alcohol dehydrogenase family)
VAAGERLLAEASKHMIPQYGLQVSVMLDANGANTTAAAAVLLAGKQLNGLKGMPALVLGGTGPVGQRVALLLAHEGAEVRVGSRQKERSEKVCATIRERKPQTRLEAAATASGAELAAAIDGQALVIASGAAGAVLLPKTARLACKSLKVAIDLNAVPPLGIEGVEVTDKAKERDGVIGYGAVGVGGTKMKIHKAAVARLFERNDQVLDAEEIFALGVL